MQAQNMGDADDDIEKRWGLAIHHWFEGQPDDLEALIAGSDRSLPPMAREFLADLVAGKVTKGKGGRPSERSFQQERAILEDIFTALDRGLTTSAAFADVAPRYAATEDAIRGVYQKLRKDITYEWWSGRGRPSLKSSK